MKPRPFTVHVAKPASDPERGVMFWTHRLASGVVQMSNVPTNFTPNFCDLHSFAFDSRECPACADSERQGRLF